MDYRVQVRPSGWRRVFRFAPYLSGADVNLFVSISTVSKERKEFGYTWGLYRFDGYS